MNVPSNLASTTLLAMMRSTALLVPVPRGLQAGSVSWTLTTAFTTPARTTPLVLTTHLDTPVCVQTATMVHIAKRRSTSVSQTPVKTMGPARIRRLGTNANASNSTQEKTAKIWRTYVYHLRAKMEEHVHLTTQQAPSPVHVKQVSPELPVMRTLMIAHQTPVCLTLIAMTWWMAMSASVIHLTLEIDVKSVSSTYLSPRTQDPPPMGHKPLT